MSAHWRLAVGGAAVTVFVALLVAGVIWYYFGAGHAGAYLYGAGIGVVSFTSIAITAALLGGRLTGDRIVLGLAVYFGRLGFAAVALGVPIYTQAWPLVPLVCGFAGVYIVENVALLMGAPTRMESSSAVRSGGAERRTGV